MRCGAILKSPCILWEDEMTFITKEQALNLALAMYVHEPCRICGEWFTRDTVHDAVWAGYSKNEKARAAHKSCWEKYANEPDVWEYK